MSRERGALTYLLVSSVHDLVGDLLDVVLDGLRLVLVLQAEGLVLDNLLLLLVSEMRKVLVLALVLALPFSPLVFLAFAGLAALAASI